MKGLFANDSLTRSLGQIVRIQMILAAVLVVTIGIWSGTTSAAAAAFGSALSIGGTLLSARSVKRASGRAGTESSRSLVPVYAGELQKFLIIGVGVAFGLVVLDLNGLFLLTGLIMAQVGYVLASVISLTGNR
ncbi:MAG: hypothetical protein DHS20C01_36390 [marine bacterium B5-7]|nr:MAG: hypothetical protein DHS20C01_36390 [marine bacterium B5-7]